MITQTVLYDPYTANIHAADQIIALAKKYLADIPGTELRVGKAIRSDRPANISNRCVIKTTTWKNEEAQKAYFEHRQLKQYVREVLVGWRFKGDPDTKESAEWFAEQILTGTSKREWERNISIPDEKVLWNGERIILHEWDA